MQCHRRQPFFTSNNVRDFHKMIVYNICQMIGRHPVRFKQNFVIQYIGVNFNFTANLILHNKGFVLWRFETNDIFVTVFNSFLYFFVCQYQGVYQTSFFSVVPVINKGFSLFFMSFSFCIQLFCSVKSIVCPPRL